MSAWAALPALWEMGNKNIDISLILVFKACYSLWNWSCNCPHIIFIFWTDRWWFVFKHIPHWLSTFSADALVECGLSEYIYRNTLFWGFAL